MDTSAFEGRWLPIRAELDGETPPGLALDQMRLTLEAGTYQVEFGGEVSDRGTYAITIEAEQTLIVLRGTHGVNAGRVIPSLIQVRGDRLRICFGLDGEFPTDFSTSENSARYLVTYCRQNETRM